MTRSEHPSPAKRELVAALRQVPMLAVLPRTIEQVQQILRMCHERGVPVVARGAGTGLSGGALPRGDGVLLNIARFMAILDIDTVNRSMRVQPGVRNLAISEAAAPFGLYYVSRVADRDGQVGGGRELRLDGGG